jgi:hypothetical protein
MRKMTSKLAHDCWLHRPRDLVSGLIHTCVDLPAEWKELRAVDACPDCLAGKHTHLGSGDGLPDVTEPGEVIAFDLWSTREADPFTNAKGLFGAICLATDYDFVYKMRYKTEVPACLKRVLQEASEHGVTVRRFHTDNEYVCNTPEVRMACETACQPWGVLFTTSNAYDSSTNSKIERHWRRLGDDGRPGFLQSMLADKWYICCLIDASAKHKELPRAGTEISPRMLFTGKKGKALPFKPFGTLAYVMLEHELNDTTTSLAKPHARARAAIYLSFHVTGELTDTHQPGWVLYVPDYHRNRPVISRHCTFVCGAYPGQPWIQAGLEGFLRINTSGDVETLELDPEGSASVSSEPVVELPKLP